METYLRSRQPTRYVSKTAPLCIYCAIQYNAIKKEFNGESWRCGHCQLSVAHVTKTKKYISLEEETKTSKHKSARCPVSLFTIPISVKAVQIEPERQ